MEDSFGTDVWTCILSTMNALEIGRARSVCRAARDAWTPVLRLPVQAVGAFPALIHANPEAEVVICDCVVSDRPYGDVSLNDLRRMVCPLRSDPHVLRLVDVILCFSRDGQALIACAVRLWQIDTGRDFSKLWHETYWRLSSDVVGAFVLSRF